MKNSHHSHRRQTSGIALYRFLFWLCWGCFVEGFWDATKTVERLHESKLVWYRFRHYKRRYCVFLWQVRIFCFPRPRFIKSQSRHRSDIISKALTFAQLLFYKHFKKDSPSSPHPAVLLFDNGGKNERRLQLWYRIPRRWTPMDFHKGKTH